MNALKQAIVGKVRGVVRKLISVSTVVANAVRDITDPRLSFYPESGWRRFSMMPPSRWHRHAPATSRACLLASLPGDEAARLVLGGRRRRAGLFTPLG